jgi:hypothetical protein
MACLADGYGYLSLVLPHPLTIKDKTLKQILTGEENNGLLSGHYFYSK